ncbi:MAG: hypothetical protein AB1938_19560 [Myxococcota bacterium]
MKRLLVGGVAVLSLWACGRVEDDVPPQPAEQALAREAKEAPSSEAKLSPRAVLPAPTSLDVRDVAPSLQAGDFVSVAGVAAPDGAHVRYMLGVVACGILVVGQGDAVVQGGRFEAPFEAGALAEWNGPVDLFLLFDEDGDGACGEADTILQVPGVTPSPGAEVDASGAAPGYTGCWLFQP